MPRGADASLLLFFSLRETLLKTKRVCSSDLEEEDEDDFESCMCIFFNLHATIFILKFDWGLRHILKHPFMFCYHQMWDLHPMNVHMHRVQGIGIP